MDSGVIQGYFGGIPVTILEVSQNYPPAWFLGSSTWLKEPNANNARKQQWQGTFLLVLQVNDIYMKAA